MLEEDYLNQKTEKPKNPKTEIYSFSDPRLKELNEYSTRLIKENIIPKLTKEINSARRYAPLRQVYYSLILAQWFKQKYGSLGSARASGSGAPVNSYINLIDSGNLVNLTSSQPYDKQNYFQQYQKSFKDGEYNLQEPVYTSMGQSIRRYVSGGIKVVASPINIKTVKEFILKSPFLIEMKATSSSVNIYMEPAPKVITTIKDPATGEMISKINDPQALERLKKEERNEKKWFKRLKNMPIPDDPQQYLNWLEQINPDYDYRGNNITPAMLERARKNLKKYLRKYPKYLNKMLRELGPGAMIVAERGERPLLPETERFEFYPISRGFKTIRGFTKGGDSKEIVYYWIQATNRKYEEARKTRGRRFVGMPFLEQGDNWEEQKWRVYLNPSPEDFESMRSILKRAAVKFDGPLEYKYLDEKSYLEKQKAGEFTQKINDPKTTKMVVNFVSEEDAIKFYELLKEVPGYQKLNPGLGPSDYARAMDGIASLARGHAEARRQRNNLKAPFKEENPSASSKAAENAEASSALLDKKGGIDLSRINKSIRTESVASSGAGGLNSQVDVDVDFDLNEELIQLQKLLNAQIIPSASRLDRYARAASASSASSSESADSALSLIAETFRLQEEKSVPAPSELKALAAWLEQ